MSFGAGRATQQQDKSEHVLEDQIQQPQRHGGDHARPLSIINRHWSTACAAFWNPAGHVGEALAGQHMVGALHQPPIRQQHRDRCMAQHGQPDRGAGAVKHGRNSARRPASEHGAVGPGGIDGSLSRGR